ncbi:hypothetical protein [[Enterobacter] lignolyticus]|uniref:hypothetical protein n=1 Tax=[Enterobacter] lignolyticus TaxID=1334193 RepID=UPI000A8F6455|nr:hypothetical protein [[Enterobacter] lignolyticus]
MKYSLPPFIGEEITEDHYLRWLKRKADSHVRRDRKRYPDLNITRAGYKEAIHEAVLRSDGKDAYTGEDLNWSLISTYDNDKSREGRHQYKAGFAMLPTVDHVAPAIALSSFEICAWKTNDAKNDLAYSDFRALCEKVIKHTYADK